MTEREAELQDCLTAVSDYFKLGRVFYSVQEQRDRILQAIKEGQGRMLPEGFDVIFLTPTVGTWEYATDSIPAGYKITEVLDEWGREGWEMCGVIQSDMVFKRPVAPEGEVTE